LEKTRRGRTKDKEREGIKERKKLNK